MLPSAPSSKPSRLLAASTALAGPVLIAAGVLVSLHGLVGGGPLERQHPDVIPYFLTTHCHLGSSLAEGHIPAWTPWVLGGMPFAADPQSGWMSLPVMALYTLLPCDVALRWFIVLQPLVAGLGLYAFLRGERLSRPAATAGGLAIALPVAGSFLGVALPFAGTVAWTALLLAAVGRLVAADAWAGRLGWTLASALAWGQLAASHFSHGLAVGTSAVVAYLAARWGSDIRSGRRSRRAVASTAGLLVGATLLVNLAYLLPRLTYLPRTTLGLGYGRLFALSERLTGDPGSLGAGTMPAGWPLRLAHWPGLYLGAVALALVFAGWWSGRRRPLVVAFATYGIVFYLFALSSVSEPVGRWAGDTRVGGLFVHEPLRFRYALLVALPVLASIGVEAWTVSRSWRRRASMVAPGVITWAVLPSATRVESGSPGVFLVWLALGLAVLAVVAWRPATLAAIPALLAVELGINALAAQPVRPPPPFFLPHSVDPADVLRPGSIASTLRAEADGRYLSLDPQAWDPIGYHVLQRPDDRPLLGMQQSLTFEIEAGQGYNPVQLLRTWSFVRAAEPKPIRYNVSFFVDPPPLALDLLQVHWAIGPAGFPPVEGAEAVATEGRYQLYRLPSVSPKASLVRAWRVVGSEEEALRAVTSPGFDPRAVAVLERDPGIEPGSEATGGGLVTYRSTGPQSARVTANAPAPSILLLRTAYDPYWNATLDGRSVPVLAADGFLQAVAIPAGPHTVVLEYDDPWIGYGLLGSAVSVWILLGGAFVLGGSGQRRGEEGSTGTGPRGGPPGQM